ncbi:hypothetical protein [Nonomuraea sp. LPB2021202275-12-8]|uniref:hypothetical protein n=1 Tax=Nonomuraea sp. LPB2021202275-12-8 TaxID=3120159 RepID=UPI00300D659C
MPKRYLAVVAAAATAVLLTPLSAAAAAPPQPLKLRNGLTLYLPIQWRVHGGGTDWIHVVTGKCAEPKGGFFMPDCRGFWILGPKAIKLGAEGFGPYNASRGGYYPASDVQLCPVNGKLQRGEQLKHSKGLRQFGPGHKAVYHEFQTRCRTLSGKSTKVRFTTREWYLPQTKILVVDNWKTRGLPTALRHADWS